MNKLYLLTYLLLFTGCATSIEDRITLNSNFYDDLTYSKVYEKSSTSFEMIDDFETKFILEVTVLSPKFREAFAKRFQDLFNEPQPVLTDSSERGAFFVSMFAAKEDMMDLSDENLWNIQLFQKDKIRKPIKIRKISNKARWRPFFKGISQWSKEFIILFDSPVLLSQDNLLDPSKAQLVISNPAGKMTVSF